MALRNLIVSSFFGGLGVFSAILLTVWLSNSTFGQRCAVEHKQYTEAWAQCVNDLARPR